MKITTYKHIYVTFILLCAGIVQLWAQPIADFTTDKIKGCTPVIVKMNNLTTGSATSYAWNFGNGTTSTAINPSVLYSAPGMYTITLTATNASGSTVKSFSIPVYASPQGEFKADKTALCGNSPIQFTDLSLPKSAAITKWFWSFGDGQYASTQNPTHKYVSEGFYSVYLQLEDANGCLSTVIQNDYISINQPKAKFIADTVICELPAAIKFTNTSTGERLSYLWNFGDGSTSTLKSPIHTYPSYKTAVVSLVVSSGGCVDSTKKTIRILDYKTNFTIAATCTSNNAFTLNFTNTGLPLATNNIWKFGDGDTAMTINANHKYLTKGTYNISLISRFNKTCIDTLTLKYESPTAKFTYSPLGCKAPFDVSFISLSKGTDISLKWNFSNGATSIISNPTTTFTVPPINASAILTATNTAGCVHSDTVKFNFPVPVAAFSVDTPFSGCAPLKVNFKDKSLTYESPIMKWKWNFGDPSSGAANVSTLQNPTHTYNNTGVFDVSLQIENSLGCLDSIVMKKRVVTGEKPSVTDFLVDKDSICFNSVHQYFDKSVYSSPSVKANYWCWAMYQNGGDLLSPLGKRPSSCPDSGFYDVNKNFTSIQNPLHNFDQWKKHILTKSHDTLFAHNAVPDTGFYYINMIVGNNGCYSEAKKKIYIKKNMAMPNFIFPEGELTLGSCKTPFTIGLHNGSFNWNQFDFFKVSDKKTKATIATLNATDTTFVTFKKAGIYEISIQTTNTLEGCTSLTTQTVTVDSLVLGEILADTACKNEMVLMANKTKSYFGLTSSFQYNFGDGFTLGGLHLDTVYHPYLDTGQYKVMMNVMSNVPYNYSNSYTTEYKMCNNFQYDSIYIEGIYPKFGVNKNVYCKDKILLFSDSSKSSSAIKYYLWNFGDGKTSLLKNPSHSYSTNGVYTVKMLLKNTYGCTDSLSKTNYINISKPVANFTESKTIGCVGDTIKFINQSSPFGALTFKWKFGASDSSTANNPMFKYNNDGVFDVFLFATNTNGCVDTMSKKALINIAKYPYVNFSSNDTVAECSPFFVSFFDSSKTNIKSWKWEMGDGNISTLQHAQNNYTLPGKYTVKLSATNGNGCVSTITKKNHITVHGPHGNYVLSPDSGCAPHKALFDLDFKETNFYIWHFTADDVKVFNYNLQKDSVYFTYTNKGIHHPWVELLDTNDCTAILKNKKIYVEKVTASFSTDTIKCSLGTLAFTNTGSAQFTISNKWNFGEKGSSTLKNPTYAFNTQGKYLVSLVMNSSVAGCADSTKKIIKVYDKPILQIDTLSKVYCIPFITEFKATNKTPLVTINKWLWQYNDQKTEANSAKFNINTTGSHTFKLNLLYGETLCKIDSAIVLTAYNHPKADFSLEPDRPSVNTTVFLSDNSQNTTKWNWDMGDGNKSNKANPGNKFVKKGKYNIKLIASNEGNCFDTLSKSIEIAPEDFVKIPSGFTPNGDGQNDYIRILNAGDMTLINFSVYNRWGQLVFQTNDINYYWDGTFKGSLQNEGTYVYQVIAVKNTTGEEVTQKGNITLIK